MWCQLVLCGMPLCSDFRTFYSEVVLVSDSTMRTVGAPRVAIQDVLCASRKRVRIPTYKDMVLSETEVFSRKAFSTVMPGSLLQPRKLLGGTRLFPFLRHGYPCPTRNEPLFRYHHPRFVPPGEAMPEFHEGGCHGEHLVSLDRDMDNCRPESH